MKDLIAPVSRHLIRHWRAAVGHHHYYFAAETLLIELERRRALAVVSQIGVHLHGALRWLGLVWLFFLRQLLLQLAGVFDRRAGAEILQFVELAKLDLALRCRAVGRGDALGP